jgi:hypothetical protein
MDNKASAEKRETEIFKENPALVSQENINAVLANPLAGLSYEQLMADGDNFAKSHGLEDLGELFQKGALVAQNPLAFNDLPLLTLEDKEALQEEVDHKWRHPKMLYYLVILCSGKRPKSYIYYQRIFGTYHDVYFSIIPVAAAVQGVRSKKN